MYAYTQTPTHMLQATKGYTIHWAPFKWKYVVFCTDHVGISSSLPSSSEHTDSSQGLATGPELLAQGAETPGQLHVLLQSTHLASQKAHRALTFLSTLSRVSGRLMSKQMSTASESG